MYTMFLEDFTYPLEKEMATHSRQRSLAGYSRGVAKSWT